ncbi:Cobalt ABC transporter, inner membrane subunit CbiQ [Candidatus Terasakiella magnetica]|uniref:Cobalt ABC transporter, inner membrane subunit CbiQ n=1 Tax=Candidatus Terasakiella magnetica TaxID=1867952 RepID=A0A1C3RE62_9PROT|nr:cobalt ECF transporter T component CbiQ [Candidatus Terasakiella magnetica]SCA55518.1 Cobalt ABC transporter, inner membrane subunit CbiQ [Candidatus Terasakiella magnetica]
MSPTTTRDIHLTTNGSWLLRLDPRARVVAACLFACTVVSLEGFLALSSALGCALFLLISAKLPAKETLKKVMAMDGFIIFLLFMLPFTTPGETWFLLGPFTATWEGLYKALEITLKANAVVMTLLALVGTIDAIALGHALNRLRVPENLVHLMLFSVRYIDVLKQEYFRLRIAMKARCFKAGNNLHTYRSIGYLLGMLLVRSLERSERILEAMKCRGFQGKFYLLDEFHFQKRDRIFSLVAFLFLTALIGLDFHYG